MKRYSGVILAVIGTAGVTFATLKPLVSFPSAGMTWWMIAGALLILSLLASAIINAGAFLSVSNAERSRGEAEHLYHTLESRLKPLLLGGLEDVLRRREQSLSTRLGEDHSVKFYVFAQIDAFHRIIASTVDATGPVRRIALKHDQGVIGFTVDRKVTVLADFANGTMYNRRGKEIGKQNSLDSIDQEKLETDLKWIYSTPIFESPQSVPWSDRIIGVLTVDSSEENGFDLFKDVSFQKEVAAIASDVAPYLVVFRTLVEKSKPGPMNFG